MGRSIETYYFGMRLNLLWNDVCTEGRLLADTECTRMGRYYLLGRSQYNLKVPMTSVWLFIYTLVRGVGRRNVGVRQVIFVVLLTVGRGSLVLYLDVAVVFNYINVF